MDSVSNVVLSVSFSYLASTASIVSSFAHPIVSLTMQNAPLSDHWSLDKQRRLSQDFTNVIKSLTARAVKRIHLAMAAPNSIVFHFGGRYGTSRKLLCITSKTEIKLLTLGESACQ
ncbi:MAG: SAVED domain-containing protein [Granulosicoccus sp.]